MTHIFKSLGFAVCLLSTVLCFSSCQFPVQGDGTDLPDASPKPDAAHDTAHDASDTAPVTDTAPTPDAPLPVQPLEVITSNAGETPVQTKPIGETTCSPLANIDGKWAFYLAPSDGSGGSLPERLISTLNFSRVTDHPEALAATETMQPGETSGYLGTFHNIALWQFNNCTIIKANDDYSPAFIGWRMVIIDADHLSLFGFGGGRARLEKTK